MTIASAPSALKVGLQRLYRVHPPLFVSAALTGLLGVFFVAGLLLDPRYVTGAPVWLKPLKFAVSISVYSFTLLWMLGFLKPSRLVRACSWVILSMFALEWAAIIVQAARGITSHFNQEFPGGLHRCAEQRPRRVVLVKVRSARSSGKCGNDSHVQSALRVPDRFPAAYALGDLDC